MNKKVSVIVPVYKAEKYLERCILSILNQTYTNLELILIDDGSPDNSGLICDKFAREDTRIKVIHKDNGGVSSARNIGIDVATGEYITFVDSDDYIDTNMLKDLCDLFSEGVDLVVSSVTMITKNDTNIYSMEDRFYTASELMESFCLEKFPIITLCAPWCKLFKRDIIVNNDLSFNENMSLSEDVVFNMQYLSKIKNIVMTSKNYYFYMRDNEESLYTKFRNSNFADLIKAYEAKLSTASILHCSDSAVTQLKQTFLFSIIATLIRAMHTSDKTTCIEFLKEISNFDYVKENLQVYKKDFRKYFIINLILKKHYNIVYNLLRLRYH